MSGFSADWLALREPVDHGAVDASLRSALRTHFAGRDALRIVDLGSGTGSNLRGLSRDLPASRQDWTLVDYDAGLLARADAPAPGITVTTIERDFSDGRIGDLVAGADLVTASALFDLVSPGVMARMAEQITEAGAVFYTVLTYDGIAAWLPQSQHDADMRRLFNAHQTRDKGFGAAAGPSATDHLDRTFRAAGYTVTRGRSAWVVTTPHDELRRAIDQGWAGAVREMNELRDADIAEWLRQRQSAEDAVTIVGHEDLLALPARP